MAAMTEAGFNMPGGIFASLGASLRALQRLSRCTALRRRDRHHTANRIKLSSPLMHYRIACSLEQRRGRQYFFSLDMCPVPSTSELAGTLGLEVALPMRR